MIKLILHLTLIIILTIITQIGGVVYLFSILLIKNNKKLYRFKRLFAFIIIYSISTFLIVPIVATYFGRIKINDNNVIESHNFLTILCNRNYVVPELNNTLIDVSKKFKEEFPSIKIIYLDANFPFFDGFPLLPHLSHNDGKKIDLSFIYENKNGSFTNLKTSRSGYGVFENPKTTEKSQTKSCLKKGFWQYDFTKYLTFGQINKNLLFSEKGTKKLIEIILKNKDVSKLFIEPHLKKRLNLLNSKIRFQGCKAVRHDDHIHFQIK